ncbi:MAG TPA: sugar ABC transporter substrate-binding protein [Verrucomicrobiales bacterium]|nr:sugar ABC transporter substrate-binding protein [Verrucomicrobiales bacterium]
MKRHALLSLAAAGLLVLAGCKPSDSGSGPASNTGGTPEKKARIAFVSNGVASFWVIAQAGVEKAAADLGVETQVIMPQGPANQKRVLEDLVSQRIDGIAVSPIDPANQTELLNMVAGRTKLITQDSDAPDSDRILYLGMNNYQAGRMCGQLVKEALPNGGKIMIFVGRTEQDNARLRRQGLIDELLNRSEDSTRNDPVNQVIEGNGFTILGTMTDNFDFPKAKANAEDALSKHPDLAGMVGLFAYNIPLMLEATEQAGKLGKVQVIAFDEADETLAGIQKGHVHGTVVQNPYEYGYQSVAVLKRIIEGDNSVVPADKFIDVPARIIRKADVDEFWADLKAKTATDE